MGLAAVAGAAVSPLSTLPVRSLFAALPPHIAAVTATDPDGDGDNDTGTIVDTFA